METEEIIKLVDGIYKNILDKFNPGARQLIGAGKAYLKALHGASAASNLFNEALAKIAVNAQQGGTIDIGSALMNIVGVYKEIQDQHMNILKAFYVDLLVPLETNLEKDTKVVQFEQKKFLQQHKMRSDSYSKAAGTMKKYRKKNSKNTPKEAEKEIKSIQAFEEEKHKLDQFCEHSLKNAMTQERRRYGFVLERQCSLAKHWMAYHHSGHMIIEKSLEHWNDVAATREFLPPNVENMFSAKQALRDVEDEDDDEDRESIASQLRKTRSIDASCLDMRSLADVANSTLQMPRAKSEFNLNNNHGPMAGNGMMMAGGGGAGHHHNHTAMMLMASGGSGKPDISHWERPTVKALYAYLSSGENQLSFLEGDRIALVGDRAKGWQFGENLRTQKFGWFPIAYAETERDDKECISEWVKAPPSDADIDITPDTSLESTLVDDSLSKMSTSYHGGGGGEDGSPTRMFGDTIQYRQSKQFRRLSRGEKPPKPGPPPQLPAPVPTPVVPNSYNGTKQRHDGPAGPSGVSGGGIPQSNSFSSAGAPPMADKRKSGSATMNFSKPPQSSSNQKPKASRNGMASASLHSSNDSGFSNEPQPQPEADLYSDEEPVNRVPIRSARSEKNLLNDHPMGRSNGGPSSRYDEDDLYGTIVPPRPRQHSQMMMRQANSYGNIAEPSQSGTLEYGYRSRTRLSDGSNGAQANQSDSQKIKRTKSFWKFSKSEDHILEGMAMWKHNDIIPTGREKREMEKKEATLKRNMRKKEQLEKQKQKEMVAAKVEEEQQQQQQQQQQTQRRKDRGNPPNPGLMDGGSNSNTLVRSGNNRESRERDREQGAPMMRERPHSIAMMPEQEKFPITKSDIDKRISKIDQEFHQQKKSSRAGEPDSRKPSKAGGKGNDTNNNSNHNRHSYAGDRDHMHQHHHQQQSHQRQDEQAIYGDSAMMAVSGKGTKDKYRTAERETSTKNRNNDALNKYYQDQTFDDFSIIPSDSIMMQDTSFYDDDGMMDDMMLMKTVRRKEILKQYYSSGTDTERNSSSSDPYDCIVVDDHLVATGGEMMMMRRGGGGGGAGEGGKSRADRKSHGGATDGGMMRRVTGDKKGATGADDKMSFSTFRGAASGGNEGGRMGRHGGDDDDDDDTMMATMTLDDELMEDEPRQQMMTRDRRSKGSKLNGANGGQSGLGESEQESRISAKVQTNGQQHHQQQQQHQHQHQQHQHQQPHQQKRKSTKSIASDGKAYGPWYDLWGTDSSVHNQKL